MGLSPKQKPLQLGVARTELASSRNSAAPGGTAWHPTYKRWFTRSPFSLLFLAPLAFGLSAHGQNSSLTQTPAAQPGPPNPSLQPHPRDEAPAVISAAAAVTSVKAQVRAWERLPRASVKGPATW